MPKFKTYLLISTLFLIGSTTGYLAHLVNTKSTPPSTAPSPTPHPVDPATKLPKYQSDPTSETPTSYIHPLRHTNEGILIQMRGTINQWNGHTATVPIDLDTFYLTFPDKVKLICQPLQIKAQNTGNTIPTTKTYLDLSRITNYSPNYSFEKIKYLLDQRPNATFLVVDPQKDFNHFLVKIVVAYGCKL